MNPKTIVLSALAAAAFASGAVDQYFHPGVAFPPTAIVFTVVGVSLIFLWYRLDAMRIGYRRRPWLDLGVIALAIVALPYYFFRSRGARRGLIATGLMLLALVGVNLLAMAGACAVYFGLQA